MLPQSCGGNLRDLRVLLDRKLIDQRIKITTGSIRFALPNRASRAHFKMDRLAAIRRVL